MIKICVNCGQELREGMKFCTACGARQPVAVPKPAPSPSPAPAPVRYDVPAPEPAAPAAAPIPERGAKKRSRLPLVLIAAAVGLIAAAGAAAGVFYARTVQQYDEMRYNDENGALVTVETYDAGKILTEEQYQDDALVFEQTYEETDAAQEIDGSDMEAIPGVTEVRLSQLYRGGAPSQVFVAAGYDRHGRILGSHVYEFNTAGELLYEYTSNYTRDRFGVLTHWEQWTADDQLMLEVDLDNSSSFGRLTSSEIRFQRNGRFMPTEDGGYVYERTPQPEIYTRTAEYRY